MTEFRKLGDILAVNKDPERETYPTQTKQAFGDEVDINHIMKKYSFNQVQPHLQQGPGAYGDFSQVVDFHTAMVAVSNAETAFMELPAKVRNRFENDPQQLLSFLDDQDNLEEARTLGLVEAAAEEIPPREENPPPEEGGESPSD